MNNLKQVIFWLVFFYDWLKNIFNYKLITFLKKEIKVKSNVEKYNVLLKSLIIQFVKDVFTTNMVGEKIDETTYHLTNSNGLDEIVLEKEEETNSFHIFLEFNSFEVLGYGLWTSLLMNDNITFLLIKEESRNYIYFTDGIKSIEISSEELLSHEYDLDKVISSIKFL